MKMETMLMNLNIASIAWGVVLWVFISWAVREKVVRRMKRVPPGPISVPLIGNLHNLSSEPHKALAELARAHGPLMFLRLGFMKTVVVSSPEVARQVLQKKDSNFSTRMIPHSISSPDHCHNELFSMPLMAIGPRWRTVRKIANTLLFSSKSLDANKGIRMKKMKSMVSYVEGCREAGVAVNVGQTVFDASLNLLSNTFFSMDLADPNSKLSREFKEVSWGIARDFAKPNLPDFFPLFRMLDPQGLRRRVTAHFTRVLSIFDQIIQQRLTSSSTRPQNDDILDALINICRQNSEDFELRQIRHLLVDLFIDGTETTSNTIEWAMAELLHDPTKLKIAQEELRRVVGRGNFVSEEDHASFPYLQAVINETLRLHPAVPLLLPRKADSDTEVNGYIIPKDSQVLVNVWAIGRDPSLWSNPNAFEPERFLTSEIDFKGNYFELVPFGSGRRICVGLPLAARMIPLLLGNLINSFDWKLEDGVAPEALNMDEKFGVALQKATPLFAIPLTV